MSAKTHGSRAGLAIVIATFRDNEVANQKRTEGPRNMSANIKELPAFETIDLNQLSSITGGDAVDTGGAIGETIGKYAGAAGGAVGGGILGGLAGGPTVAGVPVLATAGAGAGGALGYDAGGAAGRAVGRGAVQAGQWVGQQATNAWNGARRLFGGN